MILQRLRVRRFKRFSDWTVTLAPGLNVIFGPNEAGKTSLLEGLFAALLVNPAQLPPGFADQVRPWGQTRVGEVTLEFQVDGQPYLLRKDFEAGTVLLQQQPIPPDLAKRPPASARPAPSLLRLENPRDVQQRILTWFGLPSESAVRSTAYVGHGELARISDERHLIGAQLSKILSAGGVAEVDAAIRWIDEQVRKLEAEGTRRTGGNDDRLQALLQQQREVERREDRGRELAGELRIVTRRLADIERQIHVRTEQATSAERYAALRRRAEDLERERRGAGDLVQRLDALLERQAAVEEQFKEFASHNQAALTDLVRIRRTAQTLQQALRTQRQQLDREESTLEQLASRHQGSRRRAAVGSVVGGLSTAGIVGGILLALLQAWDPGWGVAGSGLLLFVVGLRMRGQVAQTGGAYRTQEQRVLDLRKQVEQSRAQLADAEKELRVRLDALGAESVESVEQRFAAYMDLVRQQDEMRASLQQMLGERSRDEVTGRLEGAERELAEVRAALEAFPEAARTAAAGLEHTTRETQTLEKEAAGLRERKAHLEGQLEGMREQADQRQLLEEQIAAHQERRAQRVETLDLLDYTRRMLEEARRQSFFPARQLLERHAGGYLRLATGNTYEKVAFDERTMTPKVWIEAAGGWRPPSALSQGTADQLYLALRLALLDVLAAGRKPPFFLDEPFVHFDAQRLQAVLPLMRHVAAQRQVFLFTSSRYADLPADNWIALPQATAEAAPAS